MKPEFKITKNNEFTTLNVAGDLTVQFCEEFKKQLLQFSGEESDLKLSLALVTCMDVFFHSTCLCIKETCKVKSKRTHHSFSS